MAAGRPLTHQQTVIRFYNDPDGVYPWTSTGTTYCEFSSTLPGCDATKCPCPCNSRPCKNGRCEAADECSSKDFKCTCAPAFYGTLCDKTCACTNRGVCVPSGDTYTCKCDYDKYWGKDCESECAQGNCAEKNEKNVPVNVTCRQSDGKDRKCTPCKAGFYGPGCDDDCGKGNCIGQHYCDQNGSNRRCDGYACVDGFWANDCTKTCALGNCVGGVSCHKADGEGRDCTAKGCKDGFWGIDCSQQCTNEGGFCEGTIRCDQLTGGSRECLGTCRAGYWGRADVHHDAVCDVPCDQGNCIGLVTCRAADGAMRVCQSCKAGFWGSDCSNPCNVNYEQCNIVNDQSVTCNADGSAARCNNGCKGSYTGDGCFTETDYCATGSPCQNGAHCTSGPTGALCVCVAGYWDSTCNSRCSDANCLQPGTCNQADGTNVVCGACKAGFFGTNCTLSCVQGNCQGAVSCNKVTGNDRVCSECAPGYTGTDCSGTCAGAENCVGSRTCRQDGTGLACTGCKDGFSGSTCTTVCGASSNCKEGTARCTLGGTVTACPQGCKAGFYGDLCMDQCAQGNCVGAVTCNQGTGGNRVCQACKEGFAGNDCGTTCAGMENCDMTKTHTCDMSGANLKCEACLPGWFGDDCHSQSDLCSPNPCQNGGVCENRDNKVTCTCAPGFYGDKCQQQCTKGNCAGQVTCASDGGNRECQGNCVAGFFESDCTKACNTSSPNCASGTVTCDKNGGNSKCSGTCVSGFYGDNCDKACPPLSNCVGLTCDKATGANPRCTSCKDNGWFGTDCSKPCTSKLDNGGRLCEGGATCTFPNGDEAQCVACPLGLELPRCDVCGQLDGDDSICDNGGTCVVDTESRSWTCSAVDGPEL